MMYPEVEKYFEKDKSLKKYYGERIYKCIESLRKQISADKQMHSYIQCKDNRYEDLYEVFVEKVENIIPIGTDIHDPEFEMYNVMHNEPFYNIWTNDLLRHMIEYKR